MIVPHLSVASNHLRWVTTSCWLRWVDGVGDRVAKAGMGSVADNEVIGPGAKVAQLGTESDPVSRTVSLS